MVDLKLSKKNAMELIELKQKLGFIDKNLSLEDKQELIKKMCEVKLGTLL